MGIEMDDQSGSDSAGAQRPAQQARRLDPAIVAAFEFAVQFRRPLDATILMDEFGADPNHVTSTGKTMVELARTDEMRSLLLTAISEREVRVGVDDSDKGAPNDDGTSVSSQSVAGRGPAGPSIQ
jgi:hypothetical protein